MRSCSCIRTIRNRSCRLARPSNVIITRLLRGWFRMTRQRSGLDFRGMEACLDYREWLSYDPMTGIFRWLKSNGGRARVGAAAGCQMTIGYVCIRVCKILLYAHRLAWWFHYGQFPKNQVDHINGNRA